MTGNVVISEVRAVYVCMYNNNNNIYLLQLGCYPVAVLILRVNKTWSVCMYICMYVVLSKAEKHTAD